MRRTQAWKQAARHLRRIPAAGSAEQLKRRRQALKRILRLNKHQAQAWYELGLIESQSGQSRRAVRCWQRAVRLNPRFAAPYFQLGADYEQNQDFYRALMAYGAFLLRTPHEQSGEAYLRFARLLARMEHEDQAVSYYLKALELQPGNAQIYFLLAETLQESGDLDSALEAYMALGKLHPPLLGFVSLQMGYLLERHGAYDEALICYDQALKKSGGSLLWKLKRDLAYPYIMQSRAQIELYHQRIQKALSEFQQAISRQPLPFHERNHQYFSMIQSNIVHIAYHHLNPLPIRQQFAQIIPKLLPDIPLEDWQARPCPTRHIHLGLICAPKSINLAYAYSGALFNEMDPARYRITVFCNSSKISQMFNSHNPHSFTHPHAQYRVISSDIAEAARQIRAEQLDLLLFTEPNWDYFQYALASLRLARAQATSWMNPGTSGLPEMDYFFSSVLIERPGAEADYSEHLVRFQTLPSHLPVYQLPEGPVSRADYGLAEAQYLYTCPQSLLKFHPDFDELLGAILRRDPQGHLALIGRKGQQPLCDLLLRRFQQTLPDVMSRIWILPEMSPHEFFGLLRISDVVLDPLYYGGGTTTYQAMAYGIPIVTLPTERMMGRITAALYAKMGLLDTVARDAGEYVEKALYFAHHPDQRRQFREGIDARRILFADRQIVEEFSQFMEALVATGAPPAHVRH